MKQANTIPTPAKPRKPRVKKSSSESLTETSSTPAETFLQVDLWTDNTSPAPSAFQPIAAQMVSDLILGASGTIQEFSDAAVSASYRSTRQAIAAVRKLCGLINGFSSTADTAAVHAAFTLCHVGDSESLSHRDPSQTEPQRVLLIGAICQAARTIPGLRFRELPAPAKAPHCTTIELLTPPHHVPAVAPLAAAAPAPAAMVKPAPVAVQPQKSVPAPPAKLPVRTPAAVPERSNPAPDSRRRLQIFVGTGVAGLVAIGGIIFALRPAAKPQTAATPTTVAAAAPPVTPQPQPTAIAPVAAVPKSSTPVEPRKQPPPPAKVKQPTPPPPQQEHETAPPPSSSGVTFSPDEIRRMIASADKLSGDGNYDRAITLYDTVLKVDRKNGAALAGRQRAAYNRDHR